MLHRIKALEARVAELEKKSHQMDGSSRDLALLQEKIRDDLASKPNRAMCPKCGEKPNHFFHVKNCTGQKKKNNDADDRPRDQSTP